MTTVVCSIIVFMVDCSLQKISLLVFFYSLCPGQEGQDIEEADKYKQCVDGTIFQMQDVKDILISSVS
jgi:hypothetical protein